MIRFVGISLLLACACARSAETNVTSGWLRVGVIQMSLGRTIAQNRNRILVGISSAATRGVRVAVFPEGALRGTDGNQPALVEQAVSAIQRAAHEAKLFVGFGGSTYSARLKKDANWMQVIGPDGRDPVTMWFGVKGVPAVVTIGRDGLWTELAELAAVVGAQVHVHLDHDSADTPEARLQRLQVWSNLASFQTFTATANVLGSAIWDDLRGLDERRAEVEGRPHPDTGVVEVYSPFSANLVVCAAVGQQLIIATRRVGPANLYHPRRTSNFNPQMDAWYRLGATTVCPKSN